MRNYGIAAAFVGGIFLASIPAAMAQTTNVAYAPAPRAQYVVFLDSENQVSGAAVNTVRTAAGAAKSATSVRVVGRADNAEAVKDQLVRDGVPAQSIVVLRREASKPLPKPADGIADPSNRRVEISF
jgi:OOP family OmpA-OmpF porin